MNGEGGRIETALRLLLRLVGSTSLFALVFVAAPYSWMDAIHAELGLGELPGEPVVGYLARSTSGFYAMLGGLFWVVSFDLQRNRSVLLYLGTATVIFGAALVAIDWGEGLPALWKWWEGPLVMAMGLALLLLTRALRPRD